ncbi:hypothetical protein [Pseudarthrobacter sp. S9]|uniref:hypothetical protein n=1 Tax=Pseudarthrobacter sp. S9 TaxID=3418421 RepID=UPI003D03DF82
MDAALVDALRNTAGNFAVSLAPRRRPVFGFDGPGAQVKPTGIAGFPVVISVRSTISASSRLSPL